MSSATLQSLLARYLADNDQGAFAEIVRTVGPLVWRVALRRLNDPQLAEEAAQNVLLAMARKAPLLARRPGLVAWLHRAATLEASALARSRRRREFRLITMARDPITPAPAPNTESPSVGPWLDEALNRLSEEERSLVIGRFYEDRPLRELAVELGKSEEAAKKQGQRALAKLEAILRRRGVGMAGGALTAMLSAELAPAAVPAQVTHSLVATTTAALQTTLVKPSLLTQFVVIMSTAKSTATATAVLLLLLATSAWHGHVNGALRNQLALLTPVPVPEPPAVRTAAQKGGVAPRPPSRLDPGASLPEPLDAASLIRAMARSNPDASGLYDPGPGMEAAQQIIGRMTPDEKWGLWRELETSGGSPAVLRLAREWVLLHLADFRGDQENPNATDPAKVLDLIVAGRFDGHTLTTMQTWAHLDPEAAWAWLGRARADGRLLRTRAGGEAPEDVMLNGFAAGLARNDLKSAIDFTHRHMADEGAEWLVAGTGSILMQKQHHSQLLELAAGLPTDQARVKALVDAAREPFDPSDVTWAVRHVLPLLDRPEFPPNLRTPVLREVAATAHGQAIWPSLLLMHEASPPEQRADNLAWLAERFAKERPSQLATTITLANPAEQRALDAALAATATAMAEHGNDRLAREFADKVRDAELRSHTLTQVAP